MALKCGYDCGLKYSKNTCSNMYSFMYLNYLERFNPIAWVDDIYHVIVNNENYAILILFDNNSEYIENASTYIEILFILKVDNGDNYVYQSYSDGYTFSKNYIVADFLSSNILDTFIQNVSADLDTIYYNDYYMSTEVKIRNGAFELAQYYPIFYDLTTAHLCEFLNELKLTYE